MEKSWTCIFEFLWEPCDQIACNKINCSRNKAHSLTQTYLSVKTCSGRSIGPGLRGSFKPPFETKLFHFHGEFSGKMYGLLVRIKLCFLDPYNIFVWVSVLA